jgi:hypothetical protein
MQAPTVFLNSSPDVEQRFCQQCGRFEPLSQFDGDKRSCRMGLQRRRATDKRRQAATAAAAATAAHMPLLCMPGGVHHSCSNCFCAGCNTAAAVHMNGAFHMQQQQAAMQAGMFGCSSQLAVPDSYHMNSAALQAAKRLKLSNNTNNSYITNHSSMSGSGSLAAAGNQQVMWGAQQQQQQQQAAAAAGDLSVMLQTFQNDHLKEWAAAELEADCALEQQLQQLQQQSAAAAITASTAVGTTVTKVSNSNNMGMPITQLPAVGRPIWRMDSDMGSSGSSTGTVAAATSAAAATDTDAALDGLLDVLYNELQARAAPAPSAAGAAVSPSTSAGSIVLNNGPAMMPVGLQAPTAAAAAAEQANIRASLASIKAELQQVTASLAGHSAAAAAAAAGGLQQPAAAVAAGQRLERIQQQMAQLSGHFAQCQAVQQATAWLRA